MSVKRINNIYDNTSLVTKMGKWIAGKWMRDLFQWELQLLNELQVLLSKVILNIWDSDFRDGNEISLGSIQQRQHIWSFKMGDPHSGFIFC